MKILRRLLLLAVICGLVWVMLRFSGQNNAPADIDLLLLQLPGVPLWIALLVAAAVGAGLTLLLVGFEFAKQGLVTRRYRKRIDSLEAEVHQLRTLPLATGGEAERAPKALPAPDSTDAPSAQGEAAEVR